MILGFVDLLAAGFADFGALTALAAGFLTGFFTMESHLTTDGLDGIGRAVGSRVL